MNERLISFARSIIILVSLTTTIILGANSCTNEKSVQIPSLKSDFDDDGVYDSTDLDDDNDGIPDEMESFSDLDEDGIPNHLDRDSDNDGIPDLIEATGVDKDGDGIIDLLDEWSDDNKNGFLDEYEVTPLLELSSTGGKTVWISTRLGYLFSPDHDTDGTPNFWDADSDNDGVEDASEVGAKLLRYKWMDSNADGFNDLLVGRIYTKGDDKQRSGHPEPEEEGAALYQSAIVDGEILGSQNGAPDFDDNENGVPDFMEPNDY